MKNIKDIPGYEVLLMSNQVSQPQPTQVRPLSQPGYDLSGNILDREAAAATLKARLQEGMTLKTTILRKKIKSIGGGESSVERVIFCSDPR